MRVCVCVTFYLKHALSASNARVTPLRGRQELRDAHNSLPRAFFLHQAYLETIAFVGGKGGGGGGTQIVFLFFWGGERAIRRQQ